MPKYKFRLNTINKIIVIKAANRSVARQYLFKHLVVYKIVEDIGKVLDYTDTEIYNEYIQKLNKNKGLKS